MVLVKKRSRVSTRSKRVSRSKRKYTPFGDVGSKLGGLFGAPGFGRAAGSMIGKIFGSGDYVMGPDTVQTNSIVKQAGGEVPKFGGPPSTIVRHREYIKDIITGPAGSFTVESFALQPGLAGTFPWLAVIAQNYDEYKIHGMVFEFKTTSGDALNNVNTALGSVIMATEYNAAVTSSFPNKQAMENQEFAQSAKPSVSQIHAIECNPKYNPQSELYVRSGAVPPGQDARWYDLGIFQIATQGFQAANVNIGELWVSYEIEFMKATQPNTSGGAIQQSFARRSLANTTTPLGSVVSAPTTGLLPVTYTTNSLSFVLQADTQYQITINYSGSNQLTSFPTPSLSGCSFVTSRSQGGLSYNWGTAAGQTVGTANLFIQNTGDVATTGTVNFANIVATGGALTYVDIFVTQLDSQV